MRRRETVGGQSGLNTPVLEAAQDAAEAAEVLGLTGEQQDDLCRRSAILSEKAKLAQSGGVRLSVRSVAVAGSVCRVGGNLSGIPEPAHPFSRLFASFELVFFYSLSPTTI